jgi:hypothetical protein
MELTSLDQTAAARIWFRGSAFTDLGLGGRLRAPLVRRFINLKVQLEVLRHARADA